MFFTTSSAAAFELDALLPDDIPGYGTPFGVTDYERLRRIDNGSGMVLGGIEINPALQASAGYDSAPNGAARGSVLLRQAPSVILEDREIGLGAFAAGEFDQYPQNARQNIAGGTLAVGERAVLPRETITVAGAYLDTQETGFALTTLAIGARPVAFTLGDARASDEISFGMFTVTPKVSVSDYRFSRFASQDRVDTVESLLTALAPGGPSQIVLLLHAAQSRYQTGFLNADTYEALAGVTDEAPAVWTIRLLAGAARRQAAQSGGSLTAPVVEASVDWRPGDLDRVRLNLAREIDDPDQISAVPYTLNQAKISLAHEYLRNVIITGSLAVANAAYLRSDLRETLINTEAEVDWHLSAALAVDADYAFNDRQANFLRAANEHVVTIGVIWTP